MDTHKRIPLSKEAVDLMKTSTPDIYEEMVKKYGAENVENNLLVPMVVLSEDSETVRDKFNKPIKVNRALIEKAKVINNSKFAKYLKHPIHALKSLVSKGDRALSDTPVYMSDGKDLDTTQNYTPITYNHSEVNSNKVEDRKGYIKGGSYRTVEIDGKLHLMTYSILIDPETKFNFLNGKLSQISPTINLDTGEISAVSFVNKPAQITNIALSSPDLVINTNDVDWDSKLEEAKAEDDRNRTLNAITQKERYVDSVAKELLNKGVITSSLKSEVKDFLTNLSSSDIQNAYSILNRVKKTPFNNKPRNLFLQGQLMKTPEELFKEFSELNKDKYKSSTEMFDAFQVFEKEQKIAYMSQPNTATLSETDDISDIEEKLKKMIENKTLTKEHKAVLAKYCGHDASLGSDGGEAKIPVGQPVDAGGGVTTPNNSTSMSAPEPVLEQNKYVETLSTAYNYIKAEKETLAKELSEIKEKLKAVSSIFGGTK